VPVAYEIAETLGLPLDVFIVRKLGVPGHSELAMGAIATGGAFVYNTDIVSQLGISEEEINHVLEAEKRELQRREVAYRGDREFPELKDKTVILVDDGIATGASIRAALKALRQLPLKKLVVAVPVADQSIVSNMAGLCDEFICPLQPDNLRAVGFWYEDFSQTEDEEVYDLLNMR